MRTLSDTKRESSSRKNKRHNLNKKKINSKGNLMTRERKSKVFSKYRLLILLDIIDAFAFFYRKTIKLDVPELH